jgi:outer membrane protein assembly factor BamB
MRTGFSTAVLLADGKVFIPNRGGTLFALEQVDARLAWKADFNTGLLQSPAYNDGRVYLAGMDMCLYAVDASTGRTVWKTDRMEGLASKDYWPVVYRGLVIVRPMGPWKAAALDEQTGRPVELTIPGGITMNGAVAPPCIDGQGKLVTAEDGGWARIDVETGQVEHISEKRDASGRRPGGTGNRDENMIASAAGDLIFVMHCEEGNAQFTGCYELDTRQWTQIRSGPWLNLISNTQGGGASQAVAAAGRLFHVSLHGLRCFEGGTAR